MSSWTPLPDSCEARALAFVRGASAGGPLDRSLRITLNFHPDRLHGGIPILQVLATEGLYRSQFETGTSNGGLTAHVGGDRWRWESRMFGGAYDEALPDRRPKYGALNHLGRATGASPRFGSAHFRLRPELAERASFCYPDSVFEPVHFGVHERCDLVAHALGDDRDRLDNYVEAHIHGPLRLADDVEALVLDPCYRGTQVEQLARRLPCALEWHPGFRLSLDALRQHAEYRGQEIVDLGMRLVRDGWLDPACLGHAGIKGRHDPQQLKKVWHILARFGDLSAARHG
ncbi:DUF3626 domain-containing protein [Massilia sp. IC2-477]|uniref:DUF3626 domain-containing protein n=1 Tax=Massilia sp. IC2-477 TaxID=2887198 RepID=UPI001D127784|nr:DUF3626 domain-containing protein [Massilia sp. IC2-477]MCC2956315.1 DUF3626 domain-containing protein [Massilia sp. IC2-477]